MIRRILIRTLAILTTYFLVAAIYVTFSGELGAQDWRNARRDPAGLAPDPATTPEAVVQVYAARTISWRGYFGVHTWIAVKPTGADAFTVYEVLGFRIVRGGGGTAVYERERAADGYWYGSRPKVLSDVRGPGVDVLIERIQVAVAAYPYPSTYHIWPGPNSNTFTAFVLRAVPELKVDLPATAVGKDYLGANPFAWTPSRTGVQFNVLGVFGVLAGWEEGLEFNLAGLDFGINPRRLTLKLPMIGDIGLGGDAEPRWIGTEPSASGPG